MEGAFCGKCGAKASDAPSAPAQAQPPMPPPAYAPPTVQNMQPSGAAPKKGSNTVLKVVFIVLGVLLLFAIIAGAGLYYAAIKVKDKVEQVAAQSGVDLEKLASQGSGSSSSEGGDGCWLLPREEAERIAGFRIVRAEQNPDGDSSKLTCQYFADPEELRKSAQAQTESAMQALKSSKGANQAAGLQELEKFTKGMLAGTAGGQNSNGLLFEIAVRRGGGQSDWAGVSIASGALGGMEKIAGVGDQALMAPMAVSLFVLKGDSFIEITLAGLPGGRQKGIDIAKAICGRL
jgi:hypothetical protein